MKHPYIHPKDCPWRGIVIRVLYLYTRLDIKCPFVPEQLDITDSTQFKAWVGENPGDFPGFYFHNGLKLFLWLVYENRLLLDDNLALE